MNLSMTLEPRDTYLYVYGYGTYDINKAKELFKEAVTVLIEHGFTKMLVDYRKLGGNETTMEQFDFAEFIADHLRQVRSKGGPTIVKLAFVGSEPLFDSSKFGETVARNRGAKMIDTDNMEEALEWLLSDETK